MIGPHFTEELRVAGLLGLQFSWTDDGKITFGPLITPDQRVAILTVLAAHDPSVPAPDIDAVRDAYVDAKKAVTDFAANSTLATAKPAIIKLAQCVEELLLALKRRIA